MQVQITHGEVGDPPHSSLVPPAVPSPCPVGTLASPGTARFPLDRSRRTSRTVFERRARLLSIRPPDARSTVRCSSQPPVHFPVDDLVTSLEIPRYKLAIRCQVAFS